MASYFNGNMTAAQMKAQYRKLALQYHPDVSSLPIDDATRIMAEINNDYAFWYARAATQEIKEDKIKGNPAYTQGYEDRYNADFITALQDKIAWLLSNAIYTRADLTVELIGVFIWISGSSLKEDVTTRTTIKGNGFVYSAGKGWYYTPSSKAGMVRTDKTIDAMGKKYGSTKIYGGKQIA